MVKVEFEEADLVPAEPTAGRVEILSAGVLVDVPDSVGHRIVADHVLY